jgi:hypothetical protein
VGLASLLELISRDKIEYVNGDIIVPIPEEARAPAEKEKNSIKEWKRMIIELQGGSWQQWYLIYLRS